MKILGYIVQCFYEDKFLPETGFKQLYSVYSEALKYAQGYAHDYLTSAEVNLEGPYELHSPTKKQPDSDGYVMVFRNGEVQIWIETIVQ